MHLVFFGTFGCKSLQKTGHEKKPYYADPKMERAAGLLQMQQVIQADTKAQNKATNHDKIYGNSDQNWWTQGMIQRCTGKTC